jgi:hypothetical protein
LQQAICRRETLHEYMSSCHDRGRSGAGALPPVPGRIAGCEADRPFENLGKGVMSAPTIDPTTRVADEIICPDQYSCGARVWVHAAGAWRPGVILSSSATAASVRYRPTDGRGTAVDTVRPHKIAPRDEDDPHLDSWIVIAVGA